MAHRIPHSRQKQLEENAFIEAIQNRIKNPFDGIEIFETQTMGRGVKTTKQICKGSVVAEYTGRLIHTRQEFLEREAFYLNDPDLTPGGFIFGFEVEGKNYWLVLRKKLLITVFCIHEIFCLLFAKPNKN